MRKALLLLAFALLLSLFGCGRDSKINITDTANANLPTIACKAGDFVYYLNAPGSSGTIIRIKETTSQKEAVYDGSEFISQISMYDDKQMLLYASDTADGQKSYYLLDMEKFKTKKFPDAAETVTGIKGATTVRILPYGDYTVFTFRVPSVSDTEDAGYHIYSKNKAGKYKLLCDNYESSGINNGMLYYTQPGKKGLYQIDLNASSQQVLLKDYDDSETAGFHVFGQTLIYETDGFLHLLDLTTKKEIKLSGKQGMVDYFNTYSMNFDRDFIYTVIAEEGLVKISYDGKTKTTLVNITLIDNWIYYSNLNITDESRFTLTPCRVKKDGAGSEALN